MTMNSYIDNTKSNFKLNARSLELDIKDNSSGFTIIYSSGYEIAKIDSENMEIEIFSKLSSIDKTKLKVFCENCDLKYSFKD